MTVSCNSAQKCNIIIIIVVAVDIIINIVVVSLDIVIIAEITKAAIRQTTQPPPSHKSSYNVSCCFFSCSEYMNDKFVGIFDRKIFLFFR